MALAAGFSLYVLARRRDPAVMLSWILSFFLLPLLPNLLYMFFGYRRLRRAHRRKPHPKASSHPKGRGEKGPLDVPPELQSEAAGLARLCEGLTGFPVTEGNRVRYFLEPQPSYDALFAAVDGARHHVHAEFYLYRDDRIGREFRAKLIAAARRGVECRLMLDAMGCLFLPSRFLTPLRQAGVKVQFFSEFRWFRKWWHIHLRNHRKLVVVDGHSAFIGSQNILENFASVRPENLPWHDAQLFFQGPVVHQLQTVFLEDWLFTTGEAVEGGAYFPEALAGGHLQAQAVPTGPDLPEQALHLIFLSLLHTAQKRIVIISPYLVPSAAMSLALEGATRRGVEVSILLPGKPDNVLARWAGRSWYRGLLIFGVKIFEVPEAVLHAKAGMIDDHITFLGSANMDVRSFQLNFEAGVILYGREPTQALARAADETMARAEPLELSTIRRQPWHYTIIEGLCRLLSPLL
jgi:cardiolipin synthase A/B